jgi:DNA-binding MarR family transcriptional regulator
MVTTRRLRRLEKAKRGSTLQLLFRCARLANDEAIERVNAAAGRPVFRGAIANLLPHISFEGIRLGALATRVGVSKQAVSKVVAEMAAEGIVELAPDPADARGRLVRFTARGANAIEHGLGILSGLERELSAKLGARRMAELHDTLLALDRLLASGALRH